MFCKITTGWYLYFEFGVIVMTYWELRDIVKRVIPRKNLLLNLPDNKSLVREKGRKVNYHQFNVEKGEMLEHKRLLNTEEIHSFIEVSLRAPYCPMPFNADTWDGILCPFRCRYCFADAFRSSLYTSFFDNGRTMGLRCCTPKYFRTELDKLMKFRGEMKEEGSDIVRSFRQQIPVRLGIRFEDFHRREKKMGVSLNFLQYFQEVEYPIMINTKSDLLGDEEYLKVLSDNPAPTAVHMTILSADPEFNRKLEPGAPTFEQRIESCKKLTEAGVRVVARIEPFMVFVNDDKYWTDVYIEKIKEAGIRHITFDTYSYSSCQPGIREGIERQGIDFERMYEIMSEAQWLGSLLLSKFMDYFRQNGFSCSTFDFGNVPANDDYNCCSVGDWFSDYGYNPGNVLTAVRFIVNQKGQPVTWDDFDSFVRKEGLWLSDSIRNSVFESWNMRGNLGYNPQWASKLEIYGQDDKGRLMWLYNKDQEDFRFEMLEGLFEKEGF